MIRWLADDQVLAPREPSGMRRRGCNMSFTFILSSQQRVISKCSRFYRAVKQMPKCQCIWFLMCLLAAAAERRLWPGVSFMEIDTERFCSSCRKRDLCCICIRLIHVESHRSLWLMKPSRQHFTAEPQNGCGGAVTICPSLSSAAVDVNQKNGANNQHGPTSSVTSLDALSADTC